ncbi:substrate-binding domain-containing protein [uncultured Faecalibaculum sp.]|uniref:substrate-binding domain-containing protein n=2 Tax=uncultured Faecalibaculum sp. TaxID=1729681 RepID=UPI00260537A0|nr:substrate-binding domain-containing protein [uncultured Faecalibaculum sp.]
MDWSDKILRLALSCCLFLTAAGCAKQPETAAFSRDQDIHLLMREDGSGTRTAFGEGTGLLKKQPDGSMQDDSAMTAAVTSSTAVMLTNVKDDPAAVGYVSLGSLNDSVRALKLDGAACDGPDVKSGGYPLARQLYLVTGPGSGEQDRAFLSFVCSDQGQEVVAASGWVPLDGQGPWQRPADVSGKIVLSGSSSVAPVMEQLAAVWEKEMPQAPVEIQQSDSSTGIQNAINGSADLGMSSRGLSESETQQGAESIPAALDGIAIIVHPANPVRDLSLSQVRRIFSGDARKWSDVSR